MRGRTVPAMLLALVLASCRSAPAATPPPASQCPQPLVFEPQVPGVTAALNRTAYWADKHPGQSADEQLIDAETIAALNRRNQRPETGFRDALGPEIANPRRAREELEERIVWLEERLADNRLVEGRPGTFAGAVARIRSSQELDEVRIVHTEAMLACVPLDGGLFTPPPDTAFDRNRCSGLHPTEVLRVLRHGGDGWVYVHAGHSVGWVRAAALTPPVEVATARAFRDDTPRVVVLADRLPVADGPVLRLGTSVPHVRTAPGGERVIRVPTPAGLVERTVPAAAPVHLGFLPLTRRNVWRLALSQLGRAYGWGGLAGERDCSRLVMDVLGTFGLRLARHSSFQAKSGADVVDLSGMTEAEKVAAIRAAGRRGVVLLYMKGHIMIYLGEDGGRDYAVSSLSEYLRPCDGGGNQVVRVDRVAVTDLELGRSTERTAFVERLTLIAVFGR